VALVHLKAGSRRLAGCQHFEPRSRNGSCALVELPPVITGIALSHREMIEEQAMRDQFGDEIDAVRELEAAIVAAETVVLGAWAGTCHPA
jgi:hypothetical protein